MLRQPGENSVSELNCERGVKLFFPGSLEVSSEEGLSVPIILQMGTLMSLDVGAVPLCLNKILRLTIFSFISQTPASAATYTVFRCRSLRSRQGGWRSCSRTHTDICRRQKLEIEPRTLCVICMWGGAFPCHGIRLTTSTVSWPWSSYFVKWS